VGRVVITLQERGRLNKSQLSRKGDISYDRLHEVLPGMVRDELVKERREGNQIIYELDRAGILLAELLKNAKTVTRSVELRGKLPRKLLKAMREA
jgi:DNA-binding transcriptional ArsR family regulator